MSVRSHHYCKLLHQGPGMKAAVAFTAVTLLPASQFHFLLGCTQLIGTSGVCWLCGVRRPAWMLAEPWRLQSIAEGALIC